MVGKVDYGNTQREWGFGIIRPTNSLCESSTGGGFALWTSSILTGNWIGVCDTNAPELNQWYHVVSTISNGVGKIYVNGKLVETFVYSEPILINSSSLKFGVLGYSSSLNFNGSIDEVRIYDRALNKNEINSLYNIGNTKHYVQIRGIDNDEISSIPKDENWTGIEPIPATYSSDSSKKTLYKEGFDTAKNEYKNEGIGLSLTDGLVGYWNFDKETFPVRDYSGNENDGINYGAVYTDDAVSGKAMEFDGDYILNPYDPNLDLTENITLSLWVKPNSLNAIFNSFIVIY
jgi:hypothetical protein